MRRGVALLLACAGLLVVPASAPAATDFGSNLSGTPAGFLNCMSIGCTTWTRSAGIATSINGVTAPANGVVTSFTLKKDGLSGGFHWGEIALRVVQLTSAGTWQGLETSTPRVRPAPVPGEETFQTRLPIGIGNYLALDSPPEALAGIFAVSSSGVSSSAVVARALPQLPADGSPASAAESAGQVLMRAHLEPDADRDGFGDETQDGCPTNAATQGACPPSPKKKCKKKKAKKRAAESKKKKCKKRKRR